MSTKHESKAETSTHDFPVRRDPLTYLWLMNQRRRGNRHNGPMCRGCGYAISGLTSSTCPECGANISELGIVDPRGIHVAPIVIAVLIMWSISVLILRNIIEPIVETSWFTEATVIVDADCTWSPTSRAYRSINLEAVGSRSANASIADPLDVEVLKVYIIPRDSPSPSHAAIAFNAHTMASMPLRHIHSRDVPTGEPEGDPKDAFLEWWTECELDPEDAAQRQELEFIWSLIQIARNLDMNQFQLTLSQSSSLVLQNSHSGHGFDTVLVPIRAHRLLRWSWFAMWLTGVVLLVWRVRRLPRRSLPAAT